MAKSRLASTAARCVTRYTCPQLYIFQQAQPTNCICLCEQNVETLTVGGATAGQEKRVLFAHGNGEGVGMATRPYRKR
jgi:hypothetical protein